MKRRILLLFVSASFFIISHASAQEWSAAQKEVWKNVQAYSDLAQKQDIDGFMSYFHADYSGWYNQSVLPGDKNSLKKWLTYLFQQSKSVVSEINPLAIKIHGNVAIVHYYYTEVTKDKEGNEKFERGRWTDILMKDGNKWLIIGDHGGPESAN